MKRINVEVEELKAQRAEKAVRLESALVEFKPLKREIYESQCEVASLKKKVETSKNSQELKDANQFYETELSTMWKRQIGPMLVLKRKVRRR